jgi:hypothetical protein
VDPWPKAEGLGCLGATIDPSPVGGARGTGSCDGSNMVVRCITLPGCDKKKHEISLYIRTIEL